MEKKPKSRNPAKFTALWPSTLPASCPFCGETTEVTLDVSGGRRQTYVEDCVVCCRPSIVHVEANEEGEPSLWLEKDDG
jgi:hypothetical protein